MHSVKLKFAVHDASGRQIIRILDKETGTLIGEIPSEVILDIKSNILEFKRNILNVSF